MRRAELERRKRRKETKHRANMNYSLIMMLHRVPTSTFLRLVYQRQQQTFEMPHFSIITRYKYRLPIDIDEMSTTMSTT